MCLRKQNLVLGKILLMYKYTETEHKDREGRSLFRIP